MSKSNRLMVLEGFQILPGSQIEIVDATTVRCTKGELFVIKKGCTAIAGGPNVQIFAEASGTKLIVEHAHAKFKAEVDGVEIIDKIPKPVVRETGVSSGSGCARRPDMSEVLSARGLPPFPGR